MTCWCVGRQGGALGPTRSHFPPPRTLTPVFVFAFPRAQHDAQLDFYGRRLATCSSDRVIKVFDVTSEEHSLTGEIAA
jgi:hypothetical protein